MLKYLRYGAPKDKEILSEFIDKYDVLIVNAHISCYCSKALSEFFYQSPGGYVIDPRTFIFQMPPVEIFDKKTKKHLSLYYNKLFTCHYSESVADKFLCTSEGLTVKELEGCYTELYNGAISSQIHAFQGTEYEKYLSPSVLITPSFALLRDYSDIDITRLLRLNIRSINDSIMNYGSKIDIGAMLIMDQEILLKDNIIQNVINCYSDAKIQYLYLWIDDFTGLKSEAKILKAYKELINGLRGHNIIDLYADYSSFLLCSANSPAPMYGVCITAGYNESRTIRVVKGMPPAAKYYLQDIHMRFAPSEFQEILAQRGYFDETISKKVRADRFYDEICDCLVCRDTIVSDIDNVMEFFETTITKGGRQQSSSDALKLAQRHYLYAKLNEVDIIERSDYKTLLKQLQDAWLNYADYGLTGLQGIGYWLKIFK